MSQIILCNKSLEYDDILTFCEDTSQEYIYYGTDGTGLIRRSLVTDSYEKIATPANIVVCTADVACTTAQRPTLKNIVLVVCW